MIRQVNINGKNVIAYYHEKPTSVDEWDDLIVKERTFRQQEGGYLVQNKWFHSDQSSKIQQMSLLLVGQNIPQGLLWKTMDGSFVEMTPELAQNIFFTAIQNETILFAQGEQFRQFVRSPEFNPETFDVTKGWVTAYWEFNK